MTLELIDLRPGPTDERWWQPRFDYEVVYEHPHWWQKQLGDERLEIQFIEVATAARGGDVGGRVVRGLTEQHPNRRFFAYSVEADWFWANLGWEPFYDSRPGPAGSPLFIQPAR